MYFQSDLQDTVSNPPYWLCQTVAALFLEGRETESSVMCPWGRNVPVDMEEALILLPLHCNAIGSIVIDLQKTQRWF